MNLDDLLNAEKITLRHKRGWFDQLTDACYRTWYTLKLGNLDFQDENNNTLSLSKQDPAIYFLTSDTSSGGMSLSIFLHKSIPNEYKEIVFFHELVEANLRYCLSWGKQTAHNKVLELQQIYVGRHYPNIAEKFKLWAQNIQI